jgi:alpha-galactosidase
VGVKVAVVGGGSSMFVPGLVRRLLEIPCFKGAELALMDIDVQRVGVMHKLATQLASAEGRELHVTSTADRKSALQGADFVIVAISVGGMAAWASDIEVPAKHGLFMHIADSIGPGGIFRAMRNTPVVAAVAAETAELSPGAIVLNYTNPASANAMAMAASPVRSASLCSCSPQPMRRSWLAALAGVEEDEVVVPLRVGGINHCTGLFSFRLRDGRDAIPLVRQRSQDEVVRWAIDVFGVVPYCWNHWVEFFPQLQRLEGSYQGRAQGLGMRYGRHIYDMDAQMARVKSWEDVAARWSQDTGVHRLADLPHGPEDEGIVVAEVMEAIIEDRPQQFVVNVLNHGLVPNLPRGVAVEVPAVVDGEGLHPIGIGEIPNGLAGVLSQHALVQQLTAQAAVSGDIGLLRQAMHSDPSMAGCLEPRQVDAMLAEMLEVNRPYLHQVGS